MQFDPNLPPRIGTRCLLNSGCFHDDEVTITNIDYQRSLVQFVVIIFGRPVELELAFADARDSLDVLID